VLQRTNEPSPIRQKGAPVKRTGVELSVYPHMSERLHWGSLTSKVDSGSLENRDLEPVFFSEAQEEWSMFRT